MSTVDKNCLLCLKDVNLGVKDNDGGGGHSHSSGRRTTRLSCIKKKGVEEIQPCTLFQLVQHPKGVGSPAHESIIHQHEGEGTCALCHKCAALSEDLAAVGGQIIALQAIVRGMVGIIRGRIIESDGKRRYKGVVQQDEGLDGLLAIRQSLLILSEDYETDNVSKAEVEVKVEMEDGIDYYEFERNDFLVEDGEFVKEDKDDHLETDSDCSFFINPQIGRRNRRGSERKIADDNPPSTTITTPKKRGRPKKVVGKQSSNKRGRPSRKISCDTLSTSTLSSTDVDEELNCDPLDMTEELSDKEEDVNLNVKKRKSFKCDSCSRSFESKTLLNNHVLYLHKYACKFCKKRFRIAKAKIAHIKSEHPGCAIYPFQCLVCQQTYPRQSRLQTHMMVKHETKDKPFVCSKCDKRFTLELNLDRHLELHKVEKEKPMVCKVCDSRFKDVARLEVHAAAHMKNFHCNLCNHSSFNKAQLERHLRTHTGEKPFACEHCQERFIDKAARQAHADKAHSTPDQHHSCTICGKTFYNLGKLKIHLDRHEGKRKKWPCGLCDKTFNCTESLNSHRIVKHGHDPIVCDECGAKVSSERRLKLHKLIHSGDKPYECHICHFRFLRKHTLVEHMKSHSSERSFVCHHCGKGFKLKKTLSAHVKAIHTADYVVPTPFLCSHCGKAYPRQGFLDDHVRQVHTGERPFVCQVCSQGFAIKAALTQHMKSHGINSTRDKGPRIPRSKRDFS